MQASVELSGHTIIRSGKSLFVINRTTRDHQDFTSFCVELRAGMTFAGVRRGASYARNLK